MDTKIVEKWHPKLVGKDYKIISSNFNLDDFNCVSFALNIYDVWCGSAEKSWPF